MKTKTYDCVAMKRQAAQRIHEETKEFTIEQKVDYWRRRSEELRRERDRLAHGATPSC